MSYHVFYKSDKSIAWATNGDVNDEIKATQAGHGYSYVQTNLTDIPQDSTHYVNDAGDSVLAKTAFNPTFSTIVPAVDGVINVTGLPAGTEVFLDGVSKGTMSDTTLTLTAKEPGKYLIEFKKLDKITYAKSIRTERQS